MAVVQSLIDTNWVGPAVFAAMTLALLLLAAYLALWATLDTSYVRMLAYMLAVLSLAFAAALGYETAAVATQAFPPFPASPTAHSKGTLWGAESPSELSGDSGRPCPCWLSTTRSSPWTSKGMVGPPTSIDPSTSV